MKQSHSNIETSTYNSFQPKSKINMKSTGVKKPSPSLHWRVYLRRSPIVVFLFAHTTPAFPLVSLHTSTNGLPCSETPKEKHHITSSETSTPLPRVFGDCSFMCDISRALCLRGERQLPQCRGAKKAVMLVFCFGFFVIVTGSGNNWDGGGSRDCIAPVLVLSRIAATVSDRDIAPRRFIRRERDKGKWIYPTCTCLS